MTFEAIRRYAKTQAARYAWLTKEGHGAEAVKVENAMIEKCGEHLGGALQSERKQWYMASQFVKACHRYGVSTRVIHLTKDGVVD